MFKNLNKYLKIFYHKNHRSFEFCDCYGICYLFNKNELGVELPLFLNEKIYNDEDVEATLDVNKRYFKNVPHGKESTGDLVILNIKGYPIHIGVVLQRGTMLHIMEKKHAKIESYNSSNWKNKVDSFWRYESSN